MRSLAHSSPVWLAAVLALSVACSEKKSAPAPAAPAKAANSNAAMFQNMSDTKRPLPPPPADESGPGNGGGQAMPAINPDSQDSPECKALAEEEKTLRSQIETHNRDVVAPASERSEALYDEYSACQEDPGCMNNLAAYQAKQGAYQGAKRAEESAEKQTEAWETRLHEISQRQAAVCNTDPL